MNKNKPRVVAISFLIIIFGFFILSFTLPKKKLSITENRNLAKLPTIENLKKGNYIAKFEEYFNDHFPFRDEMISINTKSQASLNKTKVGNYYLGKDNWILGMFPKTLDQNQLSRYKKSINYLSGLSKDMGKDVYFTMMPHKSNMLKHLYPKYTDNMDNIDTNLKNFKNTLNPDLIKYIDMDEYFLSNYSDKERENLYFKTDHHWTGYGAFEGFKMIASNMDLGLSKQDLDKHFNSYKKSIVTDKKFVGSYNQNIDMLIKENEYIVYMTKDNQDYKFDINGKEKEEKEVYATKRDDKEWDYGGAYIRGVKTNILTIKNPKALVDKKILIFRDSYQAPTTLLFADMFKEVEIADPRNISSINKTYKEIIEESNADIVMFMYNSSGFDSMIDSMIDKGIK